MKFLNHRSKCCMLLDHLPDIPNSSPIRSHGVFFSSCVFVFREGFVKCKPKFFDPWIARQNRVVASAAGGELMNCNKKDCTAIGYLGMSNREPNLIENLQA